MPAAARLRDTHSCPASTAFVAHVGGAIIGPGEPSVQIGGATAAVLGDTATCVGPAATISEGSSSVFIGGKPAARTGDATSHGGTILSGDVSVNIGG